MHQSLSGMVLIAALGVLVGCQSEPPETAQPAGEYGGYDYGDYYTDGEIAFLDQAQSNSAFDEGLSDIAFTTLDGQTTTLREHVGDHNAVLVVTRGNTSPICPYCSTQTSQYIRDYAEFQKRGTEVLLAYPVEAMEDRVKLDEFLADVRSRLQDPARSVPFPVLLDVELTAVDRLGIRRDLSKPATYIVDQDGHVRYAYVGSHWGDRPSVKAVLAELDKLPASPEKQAASAGDD